MATIEHIADRNAVVSGETDPAAFLRRALGVDAVMTAATGLLLAVGAAALGALLELPQGLLFWAGIGLLPFALFVAMLARRVEIPRGAVIAAIAVNALWAVDSILILVLGWVQPTVLGTVFVVAQALVVGVFAELQFMGLRRLTATV